MNFIIDLFSTREFVRRFDCLNNDPIVWALTLGDLVIFACYMGIAFVKFKYRRAWRTKYLAGAALFIFACGGGHLFLAATAWWPAYKAYACWNVVTALASIYFVCLLPGIIRAATDPVTKLAMVEEQLLQVRSENDRLRKQIG